MTHHLKVFSDELGISYKKLIYIGYRLKEKSPDKVFFKEKKNGSKRILVIQNNQIKLIQKKILRFLYKKIDFPNYVYGFVPGKNRGIKSNALIHTESKWIINFEAMSS